MYYWTQPTISTLRIDKIIKECIISKYILIDFLNKKQTHGHEFKKPDQQAQEEKEEHRKRNFRKEQKEAATPKRTATLIWQTIKQRVRTHQF